MSATAPPTELSDSDAAQKHEAVQKVLANTGFQRSHRLSQLLSYIAERTLARDFDALKEPVIGQRVFSRPANYSSGDDNIVRVSVRQLRRKLEDYYATDGAPDGIRLVIPKGSYALEFQSIASQATRAAPTQSRSKRRKYWPYVSTALAGICAGVLLMGTFFPRRAAPRPSTALLSLIAPAEGQRLLVVVPDFGIQTYRELAGRTLSLQDYLARRFLEPEGLSGLPPQVASLAGRLFANPATQGFILDLIPRFATIVPPEALSVRHPSTLAMEDFAKDNALLISGPNGDPWVQLFDRDLNFQIANDLDRRKSHIENRHPAGSEKRDYYNFTDSSGTVVCYARIAYLHGLSHTNHVLLVGGPHNASTEAAARFLTSPDSLPTILRLFHVANPQQLPSFELLVRSQALGNAPWTMKIIGHRLVP